MREEMTVSDRDTSLHARLARLGLNFDADHLGRARRLLAAYGVDPALLSDIVLMTVCVEAYRSEDSPAPIWV